MQLAAVALEVGPEREYRLPRRDSNAIFHATITSFPRRTLLSGPLANVTSASGMITGSTIASDSEPKLWLHVGHGAQNMYNVVLEVVSSAHSAITSVVSQNTREVVYHRHARGCRWTVLLNTSKTFGDADRALLKVLR